MVIIAPSIPVLEENRFVKETQVQGLREPMELTIMPDKNLFWIERKNNVHYYAAETKKITCLKVPIDIFSGNQELLIYYSFAVNSDFLSLGLGGRL